jgi:hypothetical protein
VSADDSRDESLNRSFVEQIDLFEMNAPSGFSGSFCIRGEYIRISRSDDQRGAGLGERRDQGPAQEAGAAELKDDFSFE